MTSTLECLCGCGLQTKGGKFLPGHDQKLRAAIEQAVGGLSQLRELAETHLGYPINTELSDTSPTVPQRIWQFLLDLNGRQICDDCITVELRLKQRQQSQQTTKPLGLTSDFNRISGTCVRCQQIKDVIAAVSK
ncbi:hypothetical protein [Pseudovibrio brasiliensis]|uniref:Uncharacterized protein n=1 Tax=Pseudovibrio brasiliensis TaxID=1898042 RepID=A0ABX8AUE2_9HYPH|nr:hypothetical protein [Pseudovibrio brasiliensis]QUS57321.1 hypothetical protein KGB56_08010 [Pseudovibrio brasiliensis]